MALIRVGLAALMALCALAIPASAQEKDKDKEKDQTNGKQSPTVWTIPDIDALPDDARGQLVRRGRDLITMTYAYVGPHAPDRDTRFAGNNCLRQLPSRSGNEEIRIADLPALLGFPTL